jgi:hypothetical protein
MKRLEIIANQSVREEFELALEAAVPGIQYTLVPIVHGKGRRKRKLGTRTWPETNFLIFSYLPEAEAAKAAQAVLSVVERFPAEGICAGISEAETIA